MAFEIKPDDLGIKKTPEVKKEVPKTDEFKDMLTFAKNFKTGLKDVKDGLNEALGLAGYSLEDFQAKAKEKLGLVQSQENKVQKPVPTPTPVIKNAEVREVKEQPKKEEKMEFDLEKNLKKIRLIVKFLKAEDKKVSEFLDEIEENKEDLKALLE